MRYIIYAPDYTTRVGGIMALHFFSDALRRNGVDAYLWPQDEGPSWWLSSKRRRWQLRRSFRERRLLPPMNVNLALDTPVASPGHLRDAVVVYGETIKGNPLRVKRVVRWFLNKPGRLGGQIQFGEGELYFFYNDVFNDPALNPDPTNKLTIYAVLEDVYRRWNFGPRKGNCYILRKGMDRAPNRATLDGPIIDDLTHEETARLFNEREFCISYDMHTTYSIYAAMCGCKSVVVPELGVSKHEWLSEGDRVGGVAYGFNDLEVANSSSVSVREALLSRQEENSENAERFIRKCVAFFGITS
jgi:hypothetical protein